MENNSVRSIKVAGKYNIFLDLNTGLSKVSKSISDIKTQTQGGGGVGVILTSFLELLRAEIVAHDIKQAIHLR